MEAQSLSALFIIKGVHLSENLQHHKRNDVQRILEEKGFKEGNSDDPIIHFFVQPGAAASEQRTLIFFDEAGFVLAQDGVQFFAAAAQH